MKKTAAMILLALLLCSAALADEVYVYKALTEGSEAYSDTALLPAEGIADCTDPSKLYVLPGGQIYHNASPSPEITIETNDGGYYNKTGDWVPMENATGQRTNLIPVVEGDAFMVTSMGKFNASVIWYDENERILQSAAYGIDSFTPETVNVVAPDGAAYVRFFSYGYSETFLSVVFLTMEYDWENTGLTFVAEDYQDKVTMLEKQVADLTAILERSNVLYGKKYVACGDSFTAGPFDEKTADTWDEDTQSYKTYPWWIAQRNGMTLVNMAHSGMRLTNLDDTMRAFSVSDYLDIPADADYITLMFGLNETNIGNKGLLIGNPWDETNATLWGAYNIVFEHILTNCPYAKVGVIIADAWMTEEYANAVKEICAYWGIPCLDLKGDDSIPMGISGRYEKVAVKAKDLRDAAFQKSEEDQHPNPKAHEYRSTIIEDFLRSL